LNFHELDIDDSLRVLLYYFSLPGEAQQIDRVVTVFSEEYCLQNPDKLCPNSSYLVAYALIMLQTDAHNPNVEKKMELSAFAGMLKHVKVNEKDSIPEPHITKLYNSVREHPLAVHFKSKRKSDL
jgi:Sec7-like guanine-nucleotide exchange factor